MTFSRPILRLHADLSINIQMRITNMKLLQFAVASLVDANTGGDYARHVSSIDTAAAERHAREIRARSVIDVARSLGDSLQAVLAEYRERREAKRELDNLLRLSDYNLADIGLHRGDLIAVKLGATTLEALNAEREARRNISSSASIERIDESSFAGNDAGLAAARCA